MHSLFVERLAELPLEINVQHARERQRIRDPCKIRPASIDRTDDNPHRPCRLPTVIIEHAQRVHLVRYQMEVMFLCKQSVGEEHFP